MWLFHSTKEVAMIREVVELEIFEIDASHNIRRACRKLANQGVNPWDLVQKYALSNDIKDSIQFVETISEEKSICKLAHSILYTGQIHPIVVRKIDGKYVSIAGQRRCIAIAVLECIRKICREGTGVDRMNASSMVWSEGIDWDLEIFANMNHSIKVFAEVVEVNDEQAERISFEENDESLAISDLDWGYDFKRLLATINPVTGKLFNYKEIADKRRKPYQFVRGRSALPYLPKEWLEKLDEDEINITEAIKYAKELRDAAEKKQAIEEDGVFEAPEDIVTSVKDFPIEKAYIIEETKPDGTPITYSDIDEPENHAVSDDSAEEDFDVKVTEDETSAVAEPVRPWTEAVRKPRSKKKVTTLSYEEVKALLMNTPRSNEQRIRAFAEVLRMDFEQAETLAENAEEYIDD